MKILIVDDESRKLSKIVNVLNSIEGLSKEDITYDLDINKARLALTTCFFDLLILDMNLPETLGESPSERGGFDLVNDILSIKSYKKPHHIVMLTEYDELQQKYEGNEDISCFPILKFDNSSQQWERKIVKLVKYILNYQLTEKINSCELAVVTAVQCEFDAVKKLYSDWFEITYKDDPTIYYKTQFVNNGSTYSMIIARQNEMGIAAASTLTSKMINHFDPKYVVMVGIAGGANLENHYGDIIIPSEVWTYNSGKYMDNSKTDTFQLELLPDPKSISLDPDILELAAKDQSDILFHIRKNWPTPISTELKILTGPMACGSAVVANREVIEKLVKNHSRKTSGVDMESYGVFYAARNFKSSSVKPICIKSISDFAGVEKSDDFQPYSAYTSANFMKYMVEKLLLF